MDDKIIMIFTRLLWYAANALFRISASTTGRRCILNGSYLSGHILCREPR